MKGRILAVACLALSVVLVPMSWPSGSAIRAMEFESRPLDAMESLEHVVDESSLLLLARVLFVDSIATSRAPSPRVEATDPRGLPIPSIRRMRRVALEPIEWLRGGLDGDVIEVLSNESWGQGHSVQLAWINSVDTLGALVRLQRRDKEWVVVDPLRTIPQRSFRAARDSALRALGRLGLDSLTARADLILVARDSLMLRAISGQSIGQMRPDRTLKGIEGTSPVAVRVWKSFRCMPGDVVFLRSTGGTEYEPVPFHRAKPPTFETEVPGGLTPGQIESSVRAVLARVEATEGSR